MSLEKLYEDLMDVSVALDPNLLLEDEFEYLADELYWSYKRLAVFADILARPKLE